MNDEWVVTRTEKLVPGGEALARIDGMTHFIPGALPGEKVRARIVWRKKGWVRTAEPEILEASPHRREPFCPLYAECGGCSWQHIDEELQLESKTAFCREALLRQGGLMETSLPPIKQQASPPRGYRARIRPVILENGRAAFRRSGSRDTVPVGYCPVATDGVNSFLSDPPGSLEAGSEPIVFGAGERAFVQGIDTLARVEVSGRVFSFNPAAFFQSNISILDKLVTAAVAAESGGSSGSGGVALDLYGGVGLFGAFLAESFDGVIGVDRDRRAREAWERHVGRKGRFFAMNLEDWIKRRNTQKPEFIVVDPPRGGLDSSVRRGLIGLRAPRISYVSCDPVTQARDLKEFLSAGYRLEDYRVFDLYPQTPHVETVARLVMGEGSNDR